MHLLYGKPIADNLLADVKEEVSKLDRMPGLAAVLVGDNSASKMYVELKKKAAKKCGMEFFDYFLPGNASEEDVLAAIRHLNGDGEIDGILVQLPLPGGLDKAKILEAIDPKKDVDGLTSENQRCIRENATCFICPFPKAIMRLLESSGVDMAGKQAFVLANSREFGEAMVGMLAAKGMDAQMSTSRDPAVFGPGMRESDAIVTAVGVPNIVRGEYVKEGAVVIDGGIDRIGDEVKGDACVEDFDDREVNISPVPGGVGPVTVACLMENVVLAATPKGNH